MLGFKGKNLQWQEDELILAIFFTFSYTQRLENPYAIATMEIAPWI